MWVALIQLTEDLNRTKRLSRRELLLPGCLELWHWTRPETLVFLDMEPASVQVGTYRMSSPGCPACQLQIVRLSSLCNHEALSYNKSLSICIGILFPYGEPWLIHTVIYLLTMVNTPHCFLFFFFYKSEMTYHVMPAFIRCFAYIFSI